jgi:hypothetical protein
MTKDDIDKLWHQAMNEAVKNGEDFTRHRFANLVAEHEREECAKLCDRMAARCNDIRAAALESAAENIRARGENT